MGHRLSKIYTRTGDTGTTGLGDGSRVPKDSQRIEAIGAVDELNSSLGVLLAEPLDDAVRELLTGIQHDLFDLGGELSIPGYTAIRGDHVTAIETALDGLNADLPPLKEFILPGGSRGAALCHVARTVCRRAERRTVTLSLGDSALSPLCQRYLNRLSDLLFVLCRVLNRQAGGSDVYWRKDRARVHPNEGSPPYYRWMMDAADSLDDLMARCALRDQRAFAELYRRCSGRLLAVAMRIVRRRDWAEDVLQESFVNIWNHVTDYSRAKSAPMTWMTAIVRNRALDWARRPRHETSDEDLDGLIENWEDDTPGPAQRLLQAGEAGQLNDCLGLLSGQQRQSIALAYMHGLSHSELAEHLGEPLGTIKTWIRRGLEKLRGCLEGKGAA